MEVLIWQPHPAVCPLHCHKNGLHPVHNTFLLHQYLPGSHRQHNHHQHSYPLLGMVVSLCPLLLAVILLHLRVFPEILIWQPLRRLPEVKWHGLIRKMAYSLILAWWLSNLCLLQFACEEYYTMTVSNSSKNYSNCCSHKCIDNCRETNKVTLHTVVMCLSIG